MTANMNAERETSKGTGPKASCEVDASTYCSSCESLEAESHSYERRPALHRTFHTVECTTYRSKHAQRRIELVTKVHGLRIDDPFTGALDLHAPAFYDA